MSYTKDNNMTLINVDNINELPDRYPNDFIEFCNENKLKFPDIKTGNGIALSLMLDYPNNYFNRKTCDKIINKFNIDSKDSIQLFNKHEQNGYKCSQERGKYYIYRPFTLTNKNAMRKNFKFDGTEEEKNKEISKIKDNIKSNYVDIPNSEWQLGHKNPDSTDNSNNNMVLQPPIQAKYRDNYIFIDTLTKIPTPKKLKKLIKKKEIQFTNEQISEYISIFQELN